MGLSEVDLSRGISRADLDQEWSDFLRDDDVVVAWTQSSLAVRPLPDRHTTRVLKSAYCNARRGSRGTLEQMFDKENFEPVSLSMRGRAGDRVAAALRMYEWLRDR